ncbi:MAG: C40 family peptidase [Chitinophagaceae bacterium]|nr:C40 family peptidase [Chitinophagaceae bacterium]
MSKVLIYLAIVGLFAISCGSIKPAASKQQTGVSKASPRFIENVSVTPTSNGSGGNNIPGSRYVKNNSNARYIGSSVTESLTPIQFKYGILMDATVEELTNVKLLEIIDEWYGARYRYGGTTKSGIDCSAFAGTLMLGVFGSSLPRTAREQYAATQRISKDELREGDLVFFNTSGGISHVGIYLNNNKFVHASTSAGVMISDLNDQYYLRKYIGAGRIL